jgi:GAF domain
MQRRGRKGQPTKGQRAVRPKPRKARTERRSTDHSPEQFHRLKRERDEALEQLIATSEVRKVISSSPSELKPVFEAMLANATRICEAKFGILYLAEGDAFRTVALYGAPPAFAEARQREPLIRAGPGISVHQAAITRQPVQVADIQAEPAYQRSAAICPP